MRYIMNAEFNMYDYLGCCRVQNNNSEEISKVRDCLLSPGLIVKDLIEGPGQKPKYV